MKIKTLIITCLFISIFSAKAENVVDKSKKTLVKNFNATKFILTPPKIALKRMNDTLDQINNDCCENNFEEIDELKKIKKQIDKCINANCQKYVIPIYNPFKPPLKVVVLSQLDVVNDLLLSNEKLKYDNLIKTAKFDSEKDILSFKEKNKKLKLTVDKMLKNYQKRISKLKEENKKLNENFDIAYEMLSKPKQKKLDKILE